MRLATALLCAAALAAPAAALAGEAETQTFTVPWFTTTGGGLVRDMTIAWDSGGRLDFHGENAVLLLPGLHRGPGDGAPAAWDGLVGRGQALDTGRLFVLRAGAPCGPGEAVTGPASRNPETGAVWGADFPALAVRDLVAVQKALSDSLGIKRVRAVVGIGFGGLQALEWRRRYPHLVEHALAVGPPPDAAPNDSSCQAGILRRHGPHGGEDAEWLPGDSGSLERALAAALAD